MTLISSASIRREARGLPAETVERPIGNDYDGEMHHSPNPRTVPPPDTAPRAEGSGGMLGLPASPPVDRGRNGKRPRPAGAH